MSASAAAAGPECVDVISSRRAVKRVGRKAHQGIRIAQPKLIDVAASCTVGRCDKELSPIKPAHWYRTLVRNSQHLLPLGAAVVSDTSPHRGGRFIHHVGLRSGGF